MKAEITWEGNYITARFENGEMRSWLFDGSVKYNNRLDHRKDEFNEKYLGKEFTYCDCQYIIEKVNIDWYAGFFVTVVVRVVGSESHGCYVIENIDCLFRPTIDKINHFVENVKWS